MRVADEHSTIYLPPLGGVAAVVAFAVHTSMLAGCCLHSRATLRVCTADTSSAAGPCWTLLANGRQRTRDQPSRPAEASDSINAAAHCLALCVCFRCCPPVQMESADATKSMDQGLFN
jgi:hypothetical protein